MFRRILVAFDGSDPAKQALRDGVELARADDGELTVLSVSLPIAAWVAEAGLTPPLDMDGVQQEVDDVFWTELDEAGEVIPSDVVSTSTLRIGDAAEEILDQVRSGGHDIVVIGSRGRGVTGPLVRGSVSRQVSEACSVPVLIVHGAKGSPPGEVSGEVPTSLAMSQGNGRFQLGNGGAGCSP
jgi:nucleotide-binding universal stress UspA family protein